MKYDNRNSSSSSSFILFAFISDADIGYFTISCAPDFTYLIDSDCSVNMANVDVITQTLFKVIILFLYYFTLVFTLNFGLGLNLGMDQHFCTKFGPK